MIDFQRLREGAVVVLNVDWGDEDGTETEEMEFITHDSDNDEIVVRDSEMETYRVDDTCDKDPGYIWKECECYNCGQLHWKPSGTVISADVPAAVEVGQKTFSDI